MSRFVLRIAGLVLVLPLAPLTQAQLAKEAPKKAIAPDTAAPPLEDYRQFFKKPRTVSEFWNALQFEIEVGRLDLAGAHLRGLLAGKPPQEELFKLGDSVGMAAILQLRNIRPWIAVPRFDEKTYLHQIERMEKAREDPEKIVKLKAELEKSKKAHEEAIAFNMQAYKDVDDLIGQVSSAIRKTLGDAERIKKFVKNLTVGPEEKSFAMKELYRSGGAVAPFLIEEYRSADTTERPHIIDAMRQLPTEILPALAASLDSDDTDLKLDVIDVIRKRAAVDLVPQLWFPSASEAQPPRVRDAALSTLSYLRDTPAAKLPAAKVALTREAERYYRHDVSFANPQAVTVWRWTGRTVAATTMPATRAEEYYGLRFASQALTLDPAYKPAQISLLSLALDKGYEQVGVAQPLAMTYPAVHDLLATVNPNLVTAVLERALSERRFHVILGAVRALGEFAEASTTRPRASGEPVLVRALNYPDKRVQMAAAEAILRMPGTPPGQAVGRVMDILRRVVATEGPVAKTAGKVLVGYFVPQQAQDVAAAVTKAGFEAVTVHTGRDVLRRLQQTADIDLILIDAVLPDPGLHSLLGQLRADQNSARLPLLIAATPNREDALRRYVERYGNVTVVPSALATDAKELEIALKAKIADPAAAPLSEAEAREYAEKAIRFLGRMGRGELAGYDIRVAAEAILVAAQSARFSPEGQIAALEAASFLSGSRPQTVLANAVIDPRRQPLLRVVAADLLTRHIQKNSALLTRSQVQTLEATFTQADLDPGVKSRVAVVLGALRPDARITGERLRGFRPVAPQPPAPPPPPKEKDDK